ncbi:MAG TPA: phosphopantetheine-binding protein [Pyrinomonadaceae bacterium]|jgi:acyl carrier protein|nr:phosphopantetheine-binding protein [Pyrinomonadaceae bacterium]
MSNRGAFAEVSALVRQTLAVAEDEPVLPEQLLFYDLNFTSLDMLDLLFRLEQHFDISIPEGTIYKLARGEMPDEDFADGAVLTTAGRASLMRLLHDSPPQIFPARIHATTLPRYCTVGAITRLVEHKLAERETCSR